MKLPIVIAMVVTTASIAAQQPHEEVLKGQWDLHAEILGHDLNQVCTFVQEGTALRGTCGEGEEGKLVGSVVNVLVTFSAHRSYDGTPVLLEYRGTLKAGRVTGDVNVTPFGVSGSFSATPTKGQPTALPQQAAASR